MMMMCQGNNVEVPDGALQVRVSKWLKELEMMFYGSSLAYDKVGVHLYPRLL